MKVTELPSSKEMRRFAGRSLCWFMTQSTDFLGADLLRRNPILNSRLKSRPSVLSTRKHIPFLFQLLASSIA